MQAVLLLSRFPSETVGESLDMKRLYDAVHVILSLQVMINYVAILVAQVFVVWYKYTINIYNIRG